MPDMTLVEANFPGFFGPFSAVDHHAVVPLVSPIVIDTPGTYRRRVPLTVTQVTIETWGGGGGGGGATGGPSGGSGGGGGAGAKVTVGAGLFVSGSVLEITVPDGGAGGAAGKAGASGGDCVVVCEGVTVVTSHGGASPAGGTNTISGHAGVAAVANSAGTAANAPFSAAGTAGGAAGAAGGAGGAGGGASAAGSPGTAPGGGGGGGGASTGVGGKGAHGRVRISWP